MSPRRTAALPPTVAIRVVHEDRPDALPAILAVVAAAGGTVRTMSTVRRLAADTEGGRPAVETEIEIEGLPEETVDATVAGAADVRERRPTRALHRIFGKRVIVVGGGAQVAQVALGAVSEADRHNLRGERISSTRSPSTARRTSPARSAAVPTSPSPLLVLAGSIMGGDISVAAEELRAVGIPVIALNMVGSITDHVDLVVGDPVQAGTMAVMAVADTATFDLARQRGRRY